MDSNRSGSLDLNEFTKALRSYGVVVNDVEIKMLFNYYDVDKNGEVCVEQGILKEELPPPSPHSTPQQSHCCPVVWL